jgi:cell division protein FtsB
MKKSKLGKTLVLLLFVYLIWVLGSGLWQLYKAGGRLDVARQNLSDEQKKNEELKKKFAEVQDSSFIEKEAREKLNMQKPGETVIVLPEMDLKSDSSADKKEIEEPNWEKWLDLFK